MKKRLPAILFICVIIAGIFAWQIPAILRALPSRYVAVMPEPVQAMGIREHVDALPTAAVLVDVSALLASATPTKPLPLPPTFTPIPEAPPTTAPLVTPTSTSTPLPSPTPLPTMAPIPPAARLEHVIHYFQDWNNCGPATLTSALSYYNVHLLQYDIATALKPDPEDRNVSPYEITDYVNNQTELLAIDRTNGDLDTLKRFISSGFPVIVEVGLYPPGEYAWMDWFGHYLLVVAYDDDQEQVWVYDSWLGTSEVPRENAHNRGRTFSYAEMNDMWRHFNRNYIVIYPPKRSDEVANIIGENMNDDLMWQNALVQVQSELQNDLENAFLWFNLGTVYNALDEYETAGIAFDKARELGLPWRMLWYQFGLYEAYYQTQRYEDIVVLADTTLQNRPYFEESYYYRGIALAALGDANGAQRNLQQAVNFNPHYTPATLALAELNKP